MATRNVVVTDRQAKLIDALVQSGQYQNASEVLREGLRLVEERMAEHAAKLNALREAVAVGMEAYERGESRLFATAEELDAYLDELFTNAIGEGERQKPKTSVQHKIVPAPSIVIAGSTE